MLRDSLSFNELYHQYKGPIQRLCRGYERSPQMAIELNQEVWAAIWKSLDAFKEECSMRTWLYRVAHNVATSHALRSIKDREFITLEQFETHQASDPSSTYEDRSTIKLVGACIFIVIWFSYRLYNATTLWSHIMDIEIILASIFVSFVILKAGRNNQAASPLISTNEYLESYRTQLVLQIRLLSRVGYWYVIPLTTGIVGLTLEKIYLAFQSGRTPLFEIAYLAFVIALGGGITYLNQVTTVRKLRKTLQLVPPEDHQSQE
jgi:RNA polymerase sigma factor (sigma-70 family)